MSVFGVLFGWTEAPFPAGIFTWEEAHSRFLPSRCAAVRIFLHGERLQVGRRRELLLLLLCWGAAAVAACCGA